MTPIKNLPLLLNSAYYGFNRALPGGDLAPTIENGVLETHCNQFIHYVCSCFGYTNFVGMKANDIVAYMDKLENGWIAVDDGVAQQHANSGVIVIAGRSNPDGHGHVNLVLPGILEKSGTYGRAVPKCANVGKDVFFGKLISFAFQSVEQPKYYALAGQIL